LFSFKSLLGVSKLDLDLIFVRLLTGAALVPA
jgi:hypothetical protein